MVVLNAPATTEDATRTWVRSDEVVLVVEVASEESEERDRGTKPVKYAQAGIRHFWRVEQEGDEPVVHVYELDVLPARPDGKGPGRVAR
jgi:Uma2 family endonuclease